MLTSIPSGVTAPALAWSVPIFGYSRRAEAASKTCAAPMIEIPTRTRVGPADAANLLRALSLHVNHARTRMGTPTDA